MMEDTATEGTPDLGAPALREWQALTERVLRGVAHSINNRAAAIAAVRELSRDPEANGATTASILGTEFESLQEVVTVLRAIGTPLRRVEAFIPSDAAREAQLVLTFHAEERDKGATFDADAAPPTRGPRWLFVRALIVLGADASARAPEGGPRPMVTLTGEDDWLVARVEGAVSGAELSACGTALAVALDGEPLHDALGFRVPTLAALRRREAR
jgi:hypothetical protein